jgi:type VI secretion system protein ImpH
VGRETDAVAFFAALAEAPYRYDFYQTLRTIECLHPDRPRWGHARRPVDEPVRLGQDAELSFAPAPLSSFVAGQGGRPPRLQVRLFGLMGPNGPLPIHLTEYARERVRHAGDQALSRFLDLFNHRFLALFYRAWAQAQPHVSRDRPADDRFADYIGGFVGIGSAAWRNRDGVPDLAKIFHAGTLIRHARNAAGLQAILEQYFEVPVEVQEFVGHWLPLRGRERTRLGGGGPPLGAGAVLGGRVWDRQSKVRLRVGPVGLAAYEAFLPGTDRLAALVDWVRLYLGFELDWDLCLVLTREEVPPLALGRGGRLGWTAWLGRRPSNEDADDLRLDAEAFVARPGAGVS